MVHTQNHSSGLCLCGCIFKTDSRPHEQPKHILQAADGKGSHRRSSQKVTNCPVTAETSLTIGHLAALTMSMGVMNPAEGTLHSSSPNLFDLGNHLAHKHTLQGLFLQNMSDHNANYNTRQSWDLSPVTSGNLHKGERLLFMNIKE